MILPKSKYVFLFLVLILFSSIVSTCRANPAANVRVIPVGGVPNGEPIVTTSPADIQIFSTSHTPITNVWLILAVNEDTYDHLTSIAAHTTTFAKSDFMEVTEDFIPPEDASGSYPGCEHGDQYQVNAIRDKLGIPATESVYYAYKAFSIDTVTTSIQTFTFAVNAPGVTYLKVLVLANGYYAPLDNPTSDGKLNEKTPWSGSTFVVPEPLTLAITLGCVAALGVYGVSRKRKPIS